MKVSYNWLKEFVDFDLAPDRLAEKLTLSGTEVETVEEFGPEFRDVVVGKILSCQPDPNRADWKWCTVSLGKKRVTTLCGAPNARVRAMVAVALPGGRLVGGRKVRVRKMGKRLSEAVLCSERELGLGEDHSGIILLPSTCRPGQPLAEALKLHDFILDIEVTPNRPDLLSVRGVAREVAALTGRRRRRKRVRVKEIGPPIGSLTSVAVRDYSLCPRYCARLLLGVTVKPSPFWLRRRLVLAGFKPINNVVDATNYILLELGHPLHAFDYRKLSGKKIVVRRALKGEDIVTIDETDRRLSPGILVIADNNNPVAIAGVMGGLNSEVSDNTVDVLLESAFFDPVSVRRTSKKLALSTEASRRFERTADPRAAAEALQRVSSLILKLAGGGAARGWIDKRKKSFKERSVWIRVSRTTDLLGLKCDLRMIRQPLTSLGLKLKERRDDRLLFQIPTWRPDLKHEVDLIEEVARLSGYDLIPAHLPVSQVVYHKKGRGEKILDEGRQILCSLGLDEVITYSFMSPSDFERLQLPLRHPLRSAPEIANPVNKEQGLLRTTLIPGMLDVVQRNMNQNAFQVQIFELGTVFTPRSSPGPPRERMLLALALSRREERDSWCRLSPPPDFYQLKGMLEVFLQRLGIGDGAFIPVTHPGFQPGQTAQLVIGGKEAGFVGVISDVVLQNYSLPAPVYLAEIEMDVFLKRSGKSSRYQRLPLYPAVRRDMAVIIKETVPYRKVRQEIQRLRPDILESYTLFDVYRGSPIPPGEKSFAFSLKYRSPCATLLEEKVNNVHQAFKKTLIRALGCRFRE